MDKRFVVYYIPSGEFLKFNSGGYDLVDDVNNATIFITAAEFVRYIEGKLELEHFDEKYHFMTIKTEIVVNPLKLIDKDKIMEERERQKNKTISSMNYIHPTKITKDNYIENKINGIITNTFKNYEW